MLIAGWPLMGDLLPGRNSGFSRKPNRAVRCSGDTPERRGRINLQRNPRTMALKCYQPELPLKKAHDVRRLEGCQCGGIGFRNQMAKIDGKFWHGRCAIATFGFDRIAAMSSEHANFRLDDIGPEAMKALLNRISE